MSVYSNYKLALGLLQQTWWKSSIRYCAVIWSCRVFDLKMSPVYLELTAIKILLCVRPIYMYIYIWIFLFCCCKQDPFYHHIFICWACTWTMFMFYIINWYSAKNKWINEMQCFWGWIHSQKGRKFWHLLQHGWILRTLLQVLKGQALSDSPCVRSLEESDPQRQSIE